MAEKIVSLFCGNYNGESCCDDFHDALEFIILRYGTAPWYFDESIDPLGVEQYSDRRSFDSVGVLRVDAGGTVFGRLGVVLAVDMDRAGDSYDWFLAFCRH